MTPARQDGVASVLHLRAPLEQSACFHGLMPSTDCDDLLKNVGDFLVRISSTESDRPTVIVSVLAHQRVVYHMLIELTDEGQYRMTDQGVLLFDSVTALARDYVHAKRVVYAKLKDGQSVTFQLVHGVDRPPWFIAARDLEICPSIQLGAGEYGDVFFGTLRVGDRGGARKVAVKICNGSTDAELDEFMNETRIMRNREHANIVRLIGVVLDRRPPYLVMEYYPGRCLHEMLRTVRPTLEDLPPFYRNVWLTDVAQGMRYLERNNILHNDLHASNCLLNDTYTTCKVGDMRMARLHTGDGVYQFPVDTPLSVMFMAPEMNAKRRTSATSDVWSFGVMVWEVYNNGKKPTFPQAPDMGINEYTWYHEKGKFFELDDVDLLPPKIRAVMEHCMQPKPEDRPTFLQLKYTMRKRSHYLGVRHLSRVFIELIGIGGKKTGGGKPK